MISSIGALAGILVGVIIPLLASPFLLGNFSIRFGWLSIVIAFVVCCGIGIVFGYLPAERAANLEPTEALRHE